MSVRVTRGLFRLWLVFSVLWIAGVGAVTWRTFPVNDWTVVGAKRGVSDEEVDLESESSLMKRWESDTSRKQGHRMLQGRRHHHLIHLIRRYPVREVQRF
jgi:hypothetical protein